MPATPYSYRAFVLFLFLCCRVTYAAIPMEAPDLNSAEVEEDANPGNVTSELFPLTEAPAPLAEPMRTEAPTIESEQEWHDLRAKIISDFGNRINSNFHVPDALMERTLFWFDIYARYGASHHVIHHALYPWIVFKVVDASETLAHGKGPQWLRVDRADKMAKAEVSHVRGLLKKLSRRSNYAHMTPEERELYDKLIAVKGRRQKVFRVAAENVRSQLGQKDFFARGLVNSSRYLPYMEEEFRHLNLPTELTRMPFVESSFNEDARSKVGASGIWQIMPRTGKAYMIVNDAIDERNSPLKATVIAGRLLHSYNHALKSWPLTITSYNHGIGNIQKAIRRAHSHDLAQIIARYHDGDFKFASSNYYVCFLAALYAEKYNELVFKESPRAPLQEEEVLKLAGKTRVRYLTKATGLDAQELLKYNLDLKSAFHTNTMLPRGFQLHLPPGHRSPFLRQVGSKDKAPTKLSESQPERTAAPPRPLG